jgi:hypothetical protein
LIESSYFGAILERERQRIFREMIESSVGLGFFNNRHRPMSINNNIKDNLNLDPTRLAHIIESNNHSSNMIRNLLKKIEGDKYRYMFGSRST